MKWNSVAAIPELLGRKDTIKNDYPKSVEEYMTQNAKKITKLTFLKIPICEIIAIINDYTNTMEKKRMYHERKYVPSLRPIIFMPSLAFDSFSDAIFVVR